MRTMAKAVTSPAVTETAKPRENFGFVDVGCGAGKSFAFGTSLALGAGLGIDISQEAVADCHKAGLAADVKDILTLSDRNIAPVSLAIDLLPEVGDRMAFETALVNTIRLARNYSVIQHNYFDNDTALALHGQFVPSNASKKIKYKPSVADYILFLDRHAASLSICGMAIFAIGEARVADLASVESQVAGDESDATQLATPKTLRVIVGRKEVQRFLLGVRAAGGGELVYRWQQA